MPEQVDKFTLRQGMVPADDFIAQVDQEERQPRLTGEGPEVPERGLPAQFLKTGHRAGAAVEAETGDDLAENRGRERQAAGVGH